MSFTSHVLKKRIKKPIMAYRTTCAFTTHLHDIGAALNILQQENSIHSHTLFLSHVLSL